MVSGLICTAQSVLGQAVSVPASAQPGRTNEQISSPPSNLPGASSQVIAPVEDQDIPVDADKVHFTLKTVRVVGGTTYNHAELRPVFAKYIGKEISLRDAYVMAAEITAKYRNDDYILTRAVVPEQDVVDGTLTIRIVEGFIGKVYFQYPDGDNYQPTAMQRRIAKRIEKTRPLTFKTLEHYMRMLNGFPGQNARAILKASPDTPGAADVHILLGLKRVGGYLQADNRGSRYQGPVEFLGGVSVNQVFDDQDQLNLRYATTYQPHELKFGEVSYNRILTPEGLRLSVLANQNTTHPGAQLKPFEIDGQDNLYEARLSYPLLRSRQSAGDIYGTFDWRDISSDVLGTELSRDHLRVARAGLNFQNFDDWNGNNTMQLELSQGLDIFGATAKGTDGSRPGASPSFQKVTAQLSREQAIAQSPWSLYSSVSGQYAPRALLASEEFGLGGERFGSAYDSSEITGESGIGGRLEARYLVIPNANPVVLIIQPYAFYDIGMVHNVDPGTGQDSDQSLASAGGGVRMSLQHGFAVSFEVAKPLTRNVAALNNNSPRFFFKLGKAF